MESRAFFWIVLISFIGSTSHYTMQTRRLPFPVQMLGLESSDAVADILFVLACAALALYSFMLLLFSLSIIYSNLVLHKPDEAEKLGDDVPGVSIVKPLMGVDPLLEHNLETHFKLKYPKFELLFCFHDDQDAAISVVHRIHRLHPHVDVKIFIGGKKDIINPMVQNMAPAYDAANYNFVWINSSRIEVSNEIIYDMAFKLQKPTVSLVHQLPFTTDSAGFGSTVEKIYFGGAMSRYYMSLNLMGLCCVTGMSYMFKKSLLDEANGLAWFGRYLAEDFFLTRALHKRGSMVLSAFPARQNVGKTALCAFTERMVRWMRLRLHMITVTSITLEPLADCFPLGLVTAWALYYLFSINPVYFFTCHIISWIIFDFILLSTAQNGPLAFSKIHYVIAWIVRELSSTYIFILALTNPHYVRWGPRAFKVKYGGLVESIKIKSVLH